MIRPASRVSLTGAAFPFVVLGLTLLSLAPIWAFRFPPMQDYPQHLFVAHVTATFADPAWNWARFYEADLRVEPFSLTYLLMRFFALGFGPETSGKLTISVAILLTAAVVMREARARKGGAEPWALLLLFPLFFSQVYYLGFVPYLLSLPLLFLSLRDLESYIDRDSAVLPTIRHASHVALLFLAHPYSVVVYIGLGLAAVPFRARERRTWIRDALPPLVTLAVFVVWYAISTDLSRLGQGGEAAFRWWPLFHGTVTFFLLPFTGMQITGGGNWLATLPWFCVVAVIGMSFPRRDRPIAVPRITLVFLFLSVCMYVALPHWVDRYSFFNLRLAPVIYVIAVFAISYVPLSQVAKVLTAVAAAGAILVHGDLHRRVSEETENLLPLLAEMAPNAPILPLLFDSSSKVMDSSFFYQFHDHDYFYYHVLVGGGANPTLFSNPMFPVQYREGARPPMPTSPESVERADLASYRYVLSRGAPLESTRFLERFLSITARSGPWVLFENPNFDAGSR